MRRRDELLGLVCPSACLTRESKSTGVSSTIPELFVLRTPPPSARSPFQATLALRATSSATASSVLGWQMKVTPFIAPAPRWATTAMLTGVAKPWEWRSSISPLRAVDPVSRVLLKRLFARSGLPKYANTSVPIICSRDRPAASSMPSFAWVTLPAPSTFIRTPSPLSVSASLRSFASSPLGCAPDGDPLTTAVSCPFNTLAVAVPLPCARPPPKPNTALNARPSIDPLRSSPAMVSTFLSPAPRADSYTDIRLSAPRK